MYNAQFVSALKEALNGLRTIHAVGEEWCSYIGKIPVGGVPYCGQEVTRSTYSALWQYAQNQGLVKSESEWQSIYAAQGGNVPYYSSGDGSSTFRMPRVVGYVRGASGQSEAGAYVKEGLPNVLGNLKALNSANQYNKLTTNSVASGALFVSNAETSAGQIGYSTTSSTGGSLGLDASRSNAIYGNSSHVTPETSVVLFGVYAFGEISNVGSLDASTLASALAKAESNIASLQSKAPYAYVTEVWSSGPNWYRKYSDGWIEQGGQSSKTSASYTVNLNTAFSDTNYICLTNFDYETSNGVNVKSRTTTSFVAYSNSNVAFRWYACGY